MNETAGDQKDGEGADGFGQKWIHNEKTENGSSQGRKLVVAENTKVTSRPYL